MRVRDIMTRKVFTIAADKKVFVVGEIMNWAHIRHVPVVDAQQRVVGIVSHRDLLRASLSTLDTHFAEAERRQHLTQGQVMAIMHQPVRTIDPDVTVQDAAGVLRRSGVGCLPVVEHGRLVGIVSEHDLLSLVERLSSKALDEAMSSSHEGTTRRAG